MNTGRAQRHLAELVGAMRTHQSNRPAVGGRRERAPQLRHAQHRLAQLAERVPASLADARIESSRIARSTARRSPRTPLPLLLNTAATRGDVAGLGIAGDETLDQLPRQERADVRMAEDIVECRDQFLRRVAARTQHATGPDTPATACWGGVVESFVATIGVTHSGSYGLPGAQPSSVCAVRPPLRSSR